MRVAERRLVAAWYVLRIVLGTGSFLAGLDKFFNILATWSMYLSPFAEHLLPVEGTVFLRAVGVLEMALGLGVLTRFTRLASYVMAVWLLAIAVNLAITGNFWDLFLRDLEIATSAFALGRLSGWRKEALDGSFAPKDSDYDAVTRRLGGAHPARPG